MCMLTLGCPPCTGAKPVSAFGAFVRLFSVADEPIRVFQKGSCPVSKGTGGGAERQLPKGILGVSK